MHSSLITVTIFLVKTKKSQYQSSAINVTNIIACGLKLSRKTRRKKAFDRIYFNDDLH